MLPTQIILSFSTFQEILVEPMQTLTTNPVLQLPGSMLMAF